MLRLRADQAAMLARLAEAAYPAEACALLVGRAEGDGLLLEEIVPARNVAADPLAGFEVDPATQIALRRRLREQDGPQDLIGHWHSHPNGRGEPSATDAAMVYEPALLWVISAVIGGRAQPPAAFRPLAAGGFAPLMLRIDS